MENLPNWRKKQHLREVLLSHFFAKKTAAESHQLLVELYGEHSLSRTQCYEWFQRFKSGDFDIKDKQRPGVAKKFEDEELETLLDEDSCQTEKELAEALGVTQPAISYRLRALGFIQKQGYWLPHELQQRDVERRFFTCEMLLARQKRKGFLHRIVTGDEKWIRFDNPKRKKSWVKPGQPSTSTAKPELHQNKIMLCIWWDQLGVVHYELLASGQTVDGPLYRQQLNRLSQALRDKRPQYAERHEKVILLHDNARPHIAKTVKQKLEQLKWDVLPHPPYSPDLAPSDYHLFRSMQHGLAAQKFSSVDDIKKWLDSWIASKDEQFFRHGIRMLPERWEKVVASDGQYFE